MPIPDIIEPIVQKDGGDCAIAALAMILQKPYVEVSKAAISLFNKPHQHGLLTREIIQLGEHLGGKFRSKLAKTIDLDNDTGVLLVRRKGGDHAVVLFNGVVFDPGDGLIYSSDVFLTTHKILRLLVPT